MPGGRQKYCFICKQGWKLEFQSTCLWVSDLQATLFHIIFHLPSLLHADEKGQNFCLVQIQILIFMLHLLQTLAQWQVLSKLNFHRCVSQSLCLTLVFIFIPIIKLEHWTCTHHQLFNRSLLLVELRN